MTPRPETQEERLVVSSRFHRLRHSEDPALAPQEPAVEQEAEQAQGRQAEGADQGDGLEADQQGPDDAHRPPAEEAGRARDVVPQPGDQGETVVDYAHHQSHNRDRSDQQQQEQGLWEISLQPGDISLEVAAVFERRGAALLASLVQALLAKTFSAAAASLAGLELRTVKPRVGDRSLLDRSQESHLPDEGVFLAAPGAEEAARGIGRAAVAAWDLALFFPPLQILLDQIQRQQRQARHREGDDREDHHEEDAQEADPVLHPAQELLQAEVVVLVHLGQKLVDPSAQAGQEPGACPDHQRPERGPGDRSGEAALEDGQAHPQSGVRRRGESQAEDHGGEPFDLGIGGAEERPQLRALVAEDLRQSQDPEGHQSWIRDRPARHRVEELDSRQIGQGHPRRSKPRDKRAGEQGDESPRRDVWDEAQRSEEVSELHAGRDTISLAVFRSASSGWGRAGSAWHLIRWGGASLIGVPPESLSRDRAYLASIGTSPLGCMRTSAMTPVRL